MKKTAALFFMFLFVVPAADAGLFGLMAKGIRSGKGVKGSVPAQVTGKEALKAAGAAGAIGLLTGAGLSASPVEAEQEAVEKEIEVAIKNREPVYYARVCLHPEKQEFYTVPQWAKFCPDGSKPKQGEGIDLTAQYSQTDMDGQESPTSTE